jgi:hypothetical protein
MATYLSLKWMADLKLESDLGSLSVVWEEVTIRFTEIDLKESQYNGARLGDPIIHSLVEDYRMGMENGDAFPKIVIYKAKSGYVVLSGNQRCAAIESLIDANRLPKTVSVEAYLVKTTDKLLLEVIARSGNVGHGERSPKEERLAHAVYSVRLLGMRHKDACKIFMVSEHAIRTHIAAEKERVDFGKQGVDMSHVPISSLSALSGLKFDESTKTKVGHLVSRHNPTVERVSQTVKAIKKARSQSGRNNEVKKLEIELAEQAHRSRQDRRGNKQPHKVPRRPRRDRLIGHLTKLTNYLESGMDGEAFVRLDDFQIAGDGDKKVIADLWKRIQFRMKVIQKG